SCMGEKKVMLHRVYYGFTFRGSIRYPIKDCIRILPTIVSFIPIIQSTFQSLIIFCLCKLEKQSNRNMNVWIMLSVAIWLFDTFNAKKYDTNKIQICQYGKTWTVIADSLIPMTIFIYRFHSCIIFLEIKSHLYDKRLSNVEYLEID
ncbi:unnamed protein product, partial [Didymodactylos carnosus]